MGDFNSTLQVDEIWGARARIDCLADYFNGLFSNNHMIDIRPHPIIPTWSNKRLEGDYIGKRLDRALVKDNLINVLGMPRSSVVASNISNHMPVLLTWRLGDRSQGLPYKFNQAWLEEHDFVNLIRESWLSKDGLDNLVGWDRFHFKMQRMKNAAKKWEINKKLALKAEIIDIKTKMKQIYMGFKDKFPNAQSNNILRTLGDRLKHILLIEEITWKLKSRNRWLKEGDLNTK